MTSRSFASQNINQMNILYPKSSLTNLQQNTHEDK